MPPPNDTALTALAGRIASAVNDGTDLTLGNADVEVINQAILQLGIERSANAQLELLVASKDETGQDAKRISAGAINAVREATLLPSSSIDGYDFAGANQARADLKAQIDSANSLSGTIGAILSSVKTFAAMFA